MSERMLVASATNLLARGFLLIPTDRKSRAGEPVNGLFAVARAIQRVMTFKTPARAVAVIDAAAHAAAWPEILKQQLGPLPGLLRALGLHVVEAADEVHVVASYAQAALDRGDGAIIVGVDKRYAQLVNDRLWWYDANKDTRYTAEIVHKRFAVPPAQVAEWLGLVGDEDQLPGIAGIGAKGATTLLETYGSVEAAFGSIDEIKGRLGNALRAGRDQVPIELARAKLDTRRPLHVPLDKLGFTPPAAAPVNALFDQLGFVELLVSDGASIKVELCETADAVTSALARFGAQPVTLHALLEDPVVWRQDIAGIALSVGDGAAMYVPGGTRLRSAGSSQSEAAVTVPWYVEKPTSTTSPAQVAERDLLAALSMRARVGIADVRVVRPDHDLRAAAAAIEVLDERVEGVGHVRVAQVPGRHAAEIHLPVVLLGVRHDAGVLLRVEVVRFPGAVLEHLDELLQHLVLAVLAQAERGLVAVALRIAASDVETPVSLLRAPVALRIGALQIAEHALHRRVHRVHVEAVEADLVARVGRVVVVCTQPADEIDDVRVAPHPLRESAEIRERLGRIVVGARAFEVAIDAVGIGPVGLGRDRGEALLADQALRELCADPVELVRAVARLAEEHEPRVTDAIEQRLVAPAASSGMAICAIA